MNESYHVLIVEDDKQIRDGIEIYLKSQGYQVSKAGDGVEGLEIIRKEKIHLAIVDVMMPRMDGIRMVMEMRKDFDFPVIMLSAKSEEVDKIMGLNMGADDYVTKPFSPTELVARVDAIYRRVAMNSPRKPAAVDMIELGEFKLNLRSRTLTKNGRYIELTQVEFQMMEYFFANPGAALSRTDILNKVWGCEYFGEEKIVDVNIRRLRMKVEEEPSEPRHLTTIWGIGYKWIV